MLAGGTGIAPMLQMLRCIHRQGTPTSMASRASKPGGCRVPPLELSLVYCVRDQDEFVERDELEAYAKSGFLKLSLMVTGGKDRVDRDRVLSTCGSGADDALGLVCGPDGFVLAMRDILNQLDYSRVAIF